jgi:hypothetical protein
MADDLTSELVKQRDLYRREIENLQRKIDAIAVLLDEAVSTRQPFEAASTAEPEPRASAKSRSPSTPDWKARRLAAADHRRALVMECERYLLEASDPIPRFELVARLERDGHAIPSMNKVGYITSLLWRHRDRIVTFYNHGYWLATRPYEPLGFKALPNERNQWILTKRRGLKRIATDAIGAEEPPPDDDHIQDQDILHDPYGDDGTASA